MTTHSVSESPAYTQQDNQPLVRRYVWLLLVLALTLISIGVQVAIGNGIVSTVLPVMVLLSIGLLRILPPKFPAINLLTDKTRIQLVAETRPIFVYGLLFPILLIPVVIWGKLQNLPLFPAWSTNWILSWNYVVVGKILLLFVPTAFFVWRYGGNARQLGIAGITNTWRWTGAILGISPFFILTCIFPLLSLSVHHLPLWLILALWAIVFFGAGFTEEYFYRVLLQTRLELLLGRWNGIAVASFLFGLLHWPSRFVFQWLGRTGSPIFDLALAFTAVVAGQGFVGFLLAYLWTRYRNAWVNVSLHLVVDSVQFMLIVAGLSSQG